jgi:alkylated DNA repair dioxygenase AlkB
MQQATSLVNKPGCYVQYVEDFLTKDEANELFDRINESVEIDWSRDVVNMFGRSIQSPRVVASVGEEGTKYRYNGAERVNSGWMVPKIKRMANRIGRYTGQRYNFCLINKYENGSDYIGYHSDKEKDIVEGSVIASVSLGATRRFNIKMIGGKIECALDLQHGSLLLMGGDTQKHYKHSLPKTAKDCGVRLNLTFRLVK